MTHTKDKEMINTNKSVSVFFGANKNTRTANIYIPFPVKEIHVRGEEENPPEQNLAREIALLSPSKQIVKSHPHFEGLSLDFLSP